MFCRQLGALSDGSHLQGCEECHNFKEDEYFQAKRRKHKHKTRRIDMHCISSSYHRGSREERSARSHLVENAADSPHVDRGGILR